MEKVWQALVDTDITRQYWVESHAGCAQVNVSDWKVGSLWTRQRTTKDATVDITCKLIESNPPHRLVISWARPAEIDDETKHSRFTFDTEPYVDGIVRLTVSHDDLARYPELFAVVSVGWPTVLSNLKTLLETGHALPQAQAKA